MPELDLRSVVQLQAAEECCEPKLIGSGNGAVAGNLGRIEPFPPIPLVLTFLHVYIPSLQGCYNVSRPLAISSDLYGRAVWRRRAAVGRR